MTRIDSVRASISATITLLERLQSELEVLHSLAYDRAVAHDTIRVRGGMPDYALDRYGDPVARKAYQELATHIQRARDSIVAGANAALDAIEKSDSIHKDNDRLVSRVPPEELLELILAQDRRLARGEFHAPATRSQPVVAGLERSALHRIKRLEKENARLRKELDRVKS